MDVFQKADVPEVGEILTRKEISERFGCSMQGGMAKSNKTNTMCLFWDENGVYPDKWEGDLLLYVGQGLTGDQKLERNNKVLEKSVETGTEIHLFKALKNRKYEYYGEVVLADKPYSIHTDRKLYVFPLRLVDLDIKDEDEYEATNILEMKLSKKLSDSELLKKISEERKRTLVRTTIQTRLARRQDVSEYTKRRAAGLCELCGKNGPFVIKGEWFLETHHIHHLAEGGSDVIENTAALCPNCHRKMHLVNDKKDVAHLKTIREKF